METFFLGTLEQLGISGVVGSLLYLLVNREAYHRKKTRDAQIAAQDKKIEDLETIVVKNETKSEKLAETLFAEIKNIGEKIGEVGRDVSEVKGYVRGKNDKGN